MPEFKTHDFCGTTIHECPDCKFDSQWIEELKAHWYNKHELPRRQEEAARRKREAEVEQIKQEISEDFTAAMPQEEHE